MYNSTDTYLGSFLILCGFSLSLINLRRVAKNNKFSTVLLSENILLICIGVAFFLRAIYNLNVVNMQMSTDGRMSSIMLVTSEKDASCTIWTILLSYGPLVISFVNSFISLVIDNYLHYEMLKDEQLKDAENIVQDMTERSVRDYSIGAKKLFVFWQKYFSFIIIGLQWIIPIFMSFLVYPMNVNERSLKVDNIPSEKCMAMLNMNNETCSTQQNYTNEIIELRKYYKPSISYLEAYENNSNGNKSTEINSVIGKLHKIISKFQNNTFFNVDETKILRQPKSPGKCVKVCYVDNKNLLLYMFILAIVSYFIPITISTMILTKIHMMNLKKTNLKTYVSRELLYNVLFWTPVMFDTFISLILCSYSMNGMKTSLLNTVANVYQTIKNFMNTKYFKNNTIVPV